MQGRFVQVARGHALRRVARGHGTETGPQLESRPKKDPEAQKESPKKDTHGDLDGAKSRN
jgi:hypothetical protein